VKRVLEFIGLSTILDDAQNAERLTIVAIKWLLSTPWWVPALLALVATGFLAYIVWRADQKWKDADKHTRMSMEAFEAYSELKRALKLRRMLVTVGDISRQLADDCRPLDWQPEKAFTTDEINKQLLAAKKARDEVIDFVTANGEEIILSSEMVSEPTSDKPLMDEKRRALTHDQKIQLRKAQGARQQIHMIQKKLSEVARAEIDLKLSS